LVAAEEAAMSEFEEYQTAPETFASLDETADPADSGDAWAESSLGGGIVEDLPPTDPDLWAESSLGGGVGSESPGSPLTDATEESPQQPGADAEPNLDSAGESLQGAPASLQPGVTNEVQSPDAAPEGTLNELIEDMGDEITPSDAERIGNTLSDIQMTIINNMR